MALLITLFLVLINIFNNITTNSPKAEGLTAIEIWMLACILFVFGKSLYTFRKYFRKLWYNFNSQNYLSFRLIDRIRCNLIQKTKSQQIRSPISISICRKGHSGHGNRSSNPKCGRRGFHFRWVIKLISSVGLTICRTL